MIDPDDTERLAENVGRRLRQIREIYGVDMKTFGEAAGLSQPRYYVYEDGTRLLTLNAAIKLCNVYNLTLDYLYMGDPSGLRANIVDKLRDMKRR